MTEADARLKALFAQDLPPARDAAFCADTMARVLRRRFQEEVAALTVLSLAGAMVLWAVWPVIQPALLAVSRGLAPALGGLAIAAAAVLFLNFQRAADAHPGT